MDRKSLALGASCLVVALFAAALAFHVFAPASAPAAPVGVAPSMDLTPLPGPKPGPAPLAAAPAPHSHAEWSKRLARQDEILVDQAKAAGCDEERAAKLRDLLVAREAQRAQTIADHEAGKLTEDEMHEAAHAQKLAFDAATKELLKPAELDALDPVAARAQVLAEEKRPR